MKKRLPSGQYFYYDERDKKLVDSFKWHIVGGYVQTEIGSRKDGTRKTLRLHRLILQPKQTEIIDHINRNPLDNRRSNLRICNKSQNGMNRGRQNNNTTGYKGVSLHKPTGKFRAYITVNGKTQHIGLFDTANIAHKKYLNKSRELHKEFSCV